MSSKLTKFGALMLAFSLTAAACGDDDEASSASETTETTAAETTETTAAAEEPGTIVEVASEAGSFNTLLAAAEAAGLVETLNGEGPLTVFAPTDDAFVAALDGLGITAEELLADTETLTSILTYHVVAGEVLSTDLTDGMMAPTVNGAELTIDLSDGVKVDGVNVITADVMASNGVIHVIDGVLLPPADDAMEDEDAMEEELPETIVDIAIEAGDFTTLLAAEELLADTETLTGILTYHAVAGKVFSTDLVDGPVTTLNGAEITIDLSDGVMVDAATVTAADLEAQNGVIHVIDAVLLPPAS